MNIRGLKADVEVEGELAAMPRIGSSGKISGQ